MKVSQPDSSLSLEVPDELLLRATIARITYRNEDNGFAVLKANLDDGSEVALVGTLTEDLAAGAQIIARGSWQTHPRFGRQFRARSIMETEPTGKAALVRYLATGPVKGFGPVLAQRVVDEFGEDTLRVIDQHPEKLLTVPGIGEKKLECIREQWMLKRNLREVMLFFQNHEISPALAQRIYKAYGERAIEQVKQNPYILAREVWGIGFKTADRIALALGLALDSVQRVRAGLLYMLKRGSDDGHSFMPTDVLVAKTGSLLGLSDEPLIRSTLTTLPAEGETTSLGDRVYLPALELAERSLARTIAERLLLFPDREISHSFVQSFLDKPTTDMSSNLIRLSPEQRQCLELAAEKSVLVITGGPGCGKTTVLRAVASMLRQAGLAIKLAAPTGRAAQRLSEVCGIEAATIHRLLRFDPLRRTFIHNENVPLPLDALIVDESSMIDVQLGASLLAAVPRGSRIIIVGDADQLPSVGPGLVLSELLRVPQLPRVALTTLFRRTNESAITNIAHQINHAIIPHIPEPDGLTKSDAYFIPSAEPVATAELVEKLVVEQIPKRFGLRGAEITVLTPMNQGELGVVSLNQRLQTRIVPQRPGLPAVRVGNLELRLGDRVVQRVNNYNLHTAGVFNGDQGEIIGIDQEHRAITVRLWDGREIDYSADSIPELDLAYALTIHRSQGSEVPAVVLVLHDSHMILLERQLVYTAVTRAKKLLVIVGTKRAFSMAVKRTRSRRRFTALSERILEQSTGDSVI